MRIFDDRINSIFEDMIRQSMGIKILLLNDLSMMDGDDDNEIETTKKINKKKEEKVFLMILMNFF